MSWIKLTPYEQAEGRLEKIYNRIKGEDGYLDNIIQVHGELPHTLEGHLSLYRNVMHHPANNFKTWWVETVAVYVSLLNQCQYCINHHATNLEQVTDSERTETMLLALKANDFEDTFDTREVVMLQYIKVLTLLPASVTESQIRKLKKEGVSDSEILELNQLVGYFSYANRMALGLGLTNEGEKLGVFTEVEEEQKLAI